MKSKKTKSIKLLAVSTLAITTLGAAVTIPSTNVFAASITKKSGDENRGKIEAISNAFATYEAAEKFAFGELEKILAGQSYKNSVVPTNPSGYVAIATIDYDEMTTKAEAEALANRVIAAADVAISGNKPTGNINKPQVETEKKISATFTDIKPHKNGVVFTAKLSEAVQHAGEKPAKGVSILTDKKTGQEVAKSEFQVQGLTKDLSDDVLYYSNIIEGNIWSETIAPGTYNLSITGQGEDQLGRTGDKRKRIFTASTDVIIPGNEENKPQPQPSPEKDAKPSEDVNKPVEKDTKPSEDANKPVENDTKPSEDANKPVEKDTKPSEGANKPVENDTKPSEDANKPSGNVIKPSEEANKPSGNVIKPSEEANKPSGNVIKPSEETNKQSANAAKLSENKSKENLGKRETKGILPNTGETASSLKFFGIIIAGIGISFVIKRKRG